MTFINQVFVGETKQNPPNLTRHPLPLALLIERAAAVPVRHPPLRSDPHGGGGGHAVLGVLAVAAPDGDDAVAGGGREQAARAAPQGVHGAAAQVVGGGQHVPAHALGQGLHAVDLEGQFQFIMCVREDDVLLLPDVGQFARTGIPGVLPIRVPDGRPCRAPCRRS